jgi:hypothetical protein
MSRHCEQSDVIFHVIASEAKQRHCEQSDVIASEAKQSPHRARTLATDLRLTRIIRIHIIRSMIPYKTNL